MAGGGSGEKTEKATPKHREEARKKGTVARSMDVNGAIVMIVGFSVLAVTAPVSYGRMEAAMRDGLQLAATPDVVTFDGLGVLFGGVGMAIAITVGPVAFACVLAGFAASVLQVKWKPSAQILMPDPRKLNPLTGAKNILGPHALFELVKSLAKVAVVGAVVAMVVTPQLDDLAGLVGMPPAELLSELAQEALAIALRAGAAYLVIAAADYAFQYYRTEKQLKMSKEDVKQEHKNQEMSAEVRGQRKRIAMEQARARMMSDVPQADVVVTNPTHYAVALRYDAEHAAPVVVAKGKDLIAAKIRRIATENDVPIVPDPPLARSLHASVEVGHMIPEELYQAVAQLLAFVYRTAGHRRALQTPTTASA